MSKIVVALALSVLMLGAVLFIGDMVGSQATNRSSGVGSALEAGNLGVNSGSGEITITMP